MHTHCDEFHTSCRTELPTKRPVHQDESSCSSGSEKSQAKLDKDEIAEKEARTVSALSLRAIMSETPAYQCLLGPGAEAGPRRYLGVMKPALMYLLFQRLSCIAYDFWVLEQHLLLESINQIS